MSDYLPPATGLTRLVLADSTPTYASKTRFVVSDNATTTPTPGGSVAVDILSTTSALVFSRMTTAERLALFAVNGMYVYDTTLNSFYGYANNAWVAK